RRLGTVSHLLPFTIVPRDLHPFPTRRSSDLTRRRRSRRRRPAGPGPGRAGRRRTGAGRGGRRPGCARSAPARRRGEPGTPPAPARARRADPGPARAAAPRPERTSCGTRGGPYRGRKGSTATATKTIVRYVIEIGRAHV